MAPSTVPRHWLNYPARTAAELCPTKLGDQNTTTANTSEGKYSIELFREGAGIEGVLVHHDSLTSKPMRVGWLYCVTEGEFWRVVTDRNYADKSASIIASVKLKQTKATNNLLRGHNPPVRASC